MEEANQVLEFLTTKNISIPVVQMVLFIVVISISMLANKIKFGLIATYAFVFYWGFVFNRDFFINAVGDTSWGLYAYVFFGLGLAVLAIITFFSHPHD